MNKEFIIRNFEESDLDDMLAIFNHFAKESFAVYGDSPLQVEQFKKIIEEATFILILLHCKKIIGFGYISSYKPYSNFGHTSVLTYFILSEHTGKILFTMISAFAEFERAIIRERVIAGMEKAKARGSKIGRPKIPLFTIQEVIELKHKGLSYKEIVKKVKISKSAYYDIVKGLE